MIVSSPIGDMPFTPERLSVQGGVITLHGSMGAWPSRVQMKPADVASFAKLVVPRGGPGWAVPIVGIAVAGLVVRRRRHRR